MFEQLNHTTNALDTATSLTDPNDANLILAGTSSGLSDPLQQNIRSASSASFSETAPGVFTVGAAGQVSFDYLFDGGAYEGEVAIFNLDGMDRYYKAGSEFFAREAALRALTNTDLGHIVISDRNQGARFNGSLPYEGDFNSGTYSGAKTFSMRPGEHFGIMLVPNGTIAEVLHNQNIDGSLSPLFSLSNMNPNSSTHFAQLANPSDYGLNQVDHNFFGIEDLRLDEASDREYNDIIFQLKGATGGASSLDQIIDSSHEWRNSETGQKLMQFVTESFDAAGNSFETAQKVTLSPNATSYTDGIGRFDTDDFYSFHLDSASPLNFALTGLSADANVQLLNSSRDIIAASSRTGSSDESINLTSLVPGDYYIRVYQYSGNTPYTFQISTSDPNDLLPTEINIGSLNGTQTFEGSLDETNKADVYRFELGTARGFNLALSESSGNAGVRLIQDYNHNGIVDADEVINGSHVFHIYENYASINLNRLEAGDYFVVIDQFSGASPYSLKISDTSPNNLLSDETNFGELSGTRIFDGSVNSSNTSDIYSFRLGSNSDKFNITLSGLSGDADLRLVQDINGNGIIDDGDVIQSSQNSGNAAEMIRQSLTAGQYFVQVNQFGNAATHYNLSISTGDFYSNWLGNAEIIGQVRAFAADGLLDRTDMINLLEGTENYGGVNDREFRDLRHLLGYDLNPNFVSLPTVATDIMPDYVRVLASKVVNGDPANERSGIGNLSESSSILQMEQLIGKWFRGTDRPEAISYNRTVKYGYQLVQGSLFQNSISYKDIDQNDLGDCYFMASLGAVALRTPDDISKMFVSENDDDRDGVTDSWTVRFFNNGVADYITVDRALPTDAAGYAVFAGWGGEAKSSNNNELWGALAEKAYAQINQSGWIRQDDTNSYNGYTLSSVPVDNNDGGLNGGQPYDSLHHITGHNTAQRSVDRRVMGIFGKEDVGRIAAAATNGAIVVLSTKGSGLPSDGVAGAHSYTLVSYDSSSERFTLYNPWGHEHSISREELLDNFSSWDFVTA